MSSTTCPMVMHPLSGLTTTLVHSFVYVDRKSGIHTARRGGNGDLADPCLSEWWRCKR